MDKPFDAAPGGGPHDLTRRALGRAALAGAASVALPAPAFAAPAAIDLPFGNGERTLARYPQKRPLILQTSRPPQLETPFAVFNDGLITPNDAFFVRYHVSGLPTDIDPATWRLKLGGLVNRELSLSLADLARDFPVREIVAVNQCSGNSRGFSNPRVAGGQLGNGAMGNARWRGVSLAAVLDRAGVRGGARQISFDGLDEPPAPTVPDFVKALDIDHARDGEVMLAWAMNGAALPFLNGFPLRLVVPGYFGTYWVKHLATISVLDREFDGYWMAKSYRIPDNDCGCVPPGTKPDKTRPIGKLNVRAFITSHADGARAKAGQPLHLRGIAFDGGSGIARVELTVDGGRTWQPTRLGEDLGRYSFREWRADIALPPGDHAVGARATSVAGEQQPLVATWNPPGYRRNVVEMITVRAAA